MITDPIANMLTAIRNAQAVRKAETTVPYSRLKHDIAELLKSEGYLTSVEALTETPKQLRLVLHYDQTRQPSIRTIKRISRPGLRIYRRHTELPVVLNNYGIAIISTSQGLMTNKEARKRKLGGEIICEVY